MLACRAGAAKVYAVDHGPIIELARELVRANGMEDRVELLRGRSQRLALPEAVDVLLADQMAPFGVGAGLLPSFSDAERRWLKPGGVSIPGALELWIAPVSHLEGYERVSFWSSAPHGLKLDPVRARAANAPQVVSLGEPALLAGGACALRFSRPWTRAGRRRDRVQLRCRRAGTVHGLVGWFVAELAKDVLISNGPGDHGHIRREQLFLPLDEPLDLERDDLLDVELQLDLDAGVLGWQLELETAEGRRQERRHSTFASMLLSREDVAAMQLADGERALAEIERLTLERHGELFATASDAAELVADVLRGATG
jgi:protein arginine N-methyltransferase 1